MEKKRRRFFKRSRNHSSLIESHLSNLMRCKRRSEPRGGAREAAGGAREMRWIFRSKRNGMHKSKALSSQEIFCLVMFTLNFKNCVCLHDSTFNVF